MMPKPPRVAAWLIDLFVPPASAEAVLGDLGEEFLVVARRSGSSAARLWYWRQALTAIPHLVWASARLSPWSTAGLVVGGLIAVTLLDSAIRQSARLLLASWNPYEYISAPRFWFVFTVLRFVAVPMTLGWMLTRVGGGRGMAVPALVAASLVVVLAWNVAVLVGAMDTLTLLRWRPPVVTRVLHMGTTVPLAICIGGILGRRRRSPATMSA
jgi:hypothetical protein